MRPLVAARAEEPASPGVKRLGRIPLLEREGPLGYFLVLPAVLYLIVWFAAQLFSGIAGGAAGSLGGGVAWWAHVGGFLFGVAAGPIAVREPERRRITRR